MWWSCVVGLCDGFVWWGCVVSLCGEWSSGSGLSGGELFGGVEWWSCVIELCGGVV